VLFYTGVSHKIGEVHDVLEDTKTPEVVIACASGQKVLSLVKELTFDDSNLTSLTYEQKKQVQNAHTAQASRRAKSIKILDRLDNLEDFARSVESGSCKLDKLERYCKVSWELQKLLGSQDDSMVDGDLVVRLRTTLYNLEKYFNLNGVVV
jgi:(p)ppGpp synthase/HD superfamily hydrolase